MKIAPDNYKNHLRKRSGIGSPCVEEIARRAACEVKRRLLAFHKI
jgi:hypothetical protein